MKTEQTPTTLAKKTGGVKSKQSITLLFNSHAEEALNILLEIMRNPKSQDSVRASAANKILDKVVPDMKAMELTGQDNGPLKLIIVKDAQALKSDE